MKKRALKTIVILLIVVPIILPGAKKIEARKLYYAEEFYLYVLNLYYTNPNLLRNIRFMQWALKAPFDNPVRSLALITNEYEFSRYKALFRMHVSLLIIDSYLQLANRFDKQHLYFFNYWYAEDLKKSFEIAMYYYKTALIYWDEVLGYASEAEKINTRINLDKWEDELFLISTGKLNYKVIIEEHIKRLENKINLVEAYLKSKNSKTG